MYMALKRMLSNSYVMYWSYFKGFSLLFAFVGEILVQYSEILNLTWNSNMEWAFLQVSSHNVLKIRGPLERKTLFSTLSRFVF